jgi:pimeloyl-ACP methyl ester carboxylesterase
VFTPTLTGVADRSHLLSREVNLETHIADVANLMLWEELSDVVLCGHSYGLVISGVADRIPDRIGALFYLDAFVLENGQSVLGTLPAGQLGEDWKVPPIPAEVFNVNAKDRDWVNRQCTMQPLATFQQPIRLTGAIDRIENVTFVLASGWGPTPFRPFYEKARAKGWKTLSIECGHDVMLDEPEALTEALLAAH